MRNSRAIHGLLLRLWRVISLVSIADPAIPRRIPSGVDRVLFNDRRIDRVWEPNQREPAVIPNPTAIRNQGWLSPVAAQSRSVQSAAPMKIIDLRKDDIEGKLLNRRYSPEPGLVVKVQSILEAVRTRGDQALIGFAQQYDGAAFVPPELRVTEQEFETALAETSPELLESLKAASRNVREFASRSRRTDWSYRNEQGARVGESFAPLERVGIYVPAGTAPLVSTAIMTVSLATTVGVPERVVVSPVGATKKMNPGLLAALHLAGATEIYKIGGAQAIGALAFGTETIKPVSKIFGPGNAYVTDAKRQVFGFVAVDLLPGPSEILVLADHTANPAWIAADLLAQAEHGRGSVICLVAFEEKVVASVRHEIDQQTSSLERRSFLESVLKENAFFLLVKDRAHAIQIVNDFAPEHLSLVVEDAQELAKAIRTAGAIFIGNYSPVAAGDFVAGPSHELPTGGAGKSFSGLTVDQFQRRTSLIQYDKESLQKSVSIISEFSRVEHLDAHGRSATIRFE
jgi:histidinol dehydrogenase